MSKKNYLSEKQIKSLLDDFKKYFPNRKDQLCSNDIIQFSNNINKILNLLNDYDLIQAYSTDPLIPMLCEKYPYIAYEHGTLRTIPFENNPVARLTSLSYKKARAVFITNCDQDNLESVEKLKIDNEKKHYIPHAFNYKRLHNYASNRLFQRRICPPYKFIMACRQHWTDNDICLSKGNDTFIKALPFLIENNFPFKLSLVEWGVDVEETKDLISQLKIENYIEWIPLQPKSKLWDMYLKYDLLVDQFAISVISGCTFEALALGCPVLTAANHKINKNFFGEAPPLISANDPKEIGIQIIKLFSSDSNYLKISRESINWIVNYHSAERIANIQSKVYSSILI